MKKPYEQPPAAVKKCLDEEYPVIAACARVEGAEIHWGDETGLRSDDVRGRSYTPKGETPIVRVSSKRHAAFGVKHNESKEATSCMSRFDMPPDSS